MLSAGGPSLAQDEVIIGIQAHRPKALMEQQWAPLKQALDRSVANHRFALKFYTVDEFEAAVNSRQVDYVLTNPAQYLLMDHRSGLSAPLVSLEGEVHGKALSLFGGVIFVRSDRSDIRTLQDLRGHSVATISASSFGGYQTQAYELQQAGVELRQEVRLVITKPPQESVVTAVMDGRADVGFVRTGLLESLALSGHLDLSKIKVLNEQNLPGFPFLISTRTYPEWVFGAMPHADKELKRDLVTFLLNVHREKALTQALGIHGFDVPQNYASVDELLRSLKAPPYDIERPITPWDIWNSYRSMVLASLCIISLFLWLAIRLFRTKRSLQVSQQQLQGVLNASAVAITWANEKGETEYVNPQFITQFGYTIADVPTTEQWWLRAYPRESYRVRVIDEWNSKVAASLPAKSAIEPMEVAVTCKDGAICHALLMASWADDKLLANFSDITERKEAEEKLQLAAMVYQNSSEAMMVTDQNNNIVAINRSFTELSGYDERDVLAKNPRILSSGRQDVKFYKAMWAAINSTGRWQGELWNRRKNGEAYPEWLTIGTICNEDGTVHRRVAQFIDITDKKKSEEELLSHANYDQLTLLPNRRLFIDRLEQEIRKSAREKSRTALLFIDLDHFKDVNDTLGHDVGDKLLIEAAGRIKSCVRDYDTVARLGGDEFTIVLSELGDTMDVGRIAQSIIDSLKQPFLLAGNESFISASIGIAICPDDGTKSVDLIKHADRALYVAKDEGRSRFSFFTKAMQEASDARIQLGVDLRHAIYKGQLEVYYQPIVELTSGHTHKAEALLRWKHPVHGFVSPEDFIPVAEDTGSILDIGNWVFMQAAQQVKKLMDHGQDFQISVNKSPVQFNSSEQHHNLWVEKLKTLGLPGRSIAVEITEGLLIDSDPSINEKLLKLRDAGIQVSIDDFGTGYSSLAYLKKFDIDFLKIDQSFIRNLSRGVEELAICEAIVVMAHKLGIKVIAEGIETEQQCALLKQMDCDYGQGYLFSRPVPAPEFEKWLLEN